MKTLILLIALLALPLLAENEPMRDLDKIDAALKSAPDDPILHYRKCQALFAKGREQEAVDHAAIALEKFKASGNKLAWMFLGFIKTKKYVIEVHYNMGKSERADTRDGIVRPMSFRVWTTNTEPKLVRILDFELGYIDGKVDTAAIGEMSEDVHFNLGMIDPHSDFAKIKKRVLKIIKE